jgi:hypothetical protein
MGCSSTSAVTYIRIPTWQQIINYNIWEGSVPILAVRLKNNITANRWVRTINGFEILASSS